MFVHLQHGQLAASSDRLVTDPSVSDSIGLIEVKCLYSCRNISPLEEVNTKGSTSAFPVKNVIGENIIMKESQSYYYQVQMQMGVTGRKWCDFSSVY